MANAASTRSKRRAVNLASQPSQPHPDRAAALELLTEEIGFIHNADFEALDEATVADLVAEAELYRDDVPVSGKVPDGLPPYLADLYAIPLLSPEGEVALFRQLNFLRYLANAHRATLDPDQPDGLLVAEIRRLLAKADDVRNQLVECNLRLVVSIARRFSTEGRLTFEELVSEGNMILMKAVEKFDYSRGFRFSTYATHAVQRHFYRQFRNSRRRNRQEIATTEEILSELAEHETDQPLAQGLTEAQVGDILARIGDELDERGQYIVRERFGLGPSGDVRTLQSLSQELDVSKERVRQLHHKAIAKLRNMIERLHPDIVTA